MNGGKVVLTKMELRPGPGQNALPLMDSADPNASRYVDPVIEAYKPGIDRTIFRHNLQLTIEQRIDALTELMKSIEAMQEVGRRARREER